MKENNKTVLVDWEEKITAEIDPLTEAYAELGRAFYDYRFEEPTPELLLFFDRISELKQKLKERSKRDDHLEEIQPKPAADTAHPTPPQPAVDPSESSKTEQSFQSEQDGLYSDSGDTVLVNTPGSGSSLYQKPKPDIIKTIDDLPDLSGASGASADRTPAVPGDPEAKFCPECGSSVSPNDLYCGNCGFRLK